jgi:hypothetical protein
MENRKRPRFPTGRAFHATDYSQGLGSGGNLRSKLAEIDVVELVLAEEMDGQEKQAIDEVLIARPTVCPRSGAEIQIAELASIESPARPKCAAQPAGGDKSGA